MQPNRSWRIYVQDMVESCRRIETYIKHMSEKSFLKDTMRIDAVVRYLEILGEATKHVPEDIKAKAEDVPWKKIEAMRNLVSHEYFGIDAGLVWKTSEEDIPRLRKNLEDLLHGVGVCAKALMLFGKTMQFNRLASLAQPSRGRAQEQAIWVSWFWL